MDEFTDFSQFFELPVDTIKELSYPNAPDWATEIAKGNVRFIDPNKIPKFWSAESLADYMTVCKYTITSCPEKQLDLSIRFLTGKEARAISEPTSLTSTHYTEGKLQFTFLPLRGGIKYIRLGKGRYSYFILDFSEICLDWKDLEWILVNINLPIGPYPSFGKIARNLILEYGIKGGLIGEIPEDVKLLATQVFGIGRFEAFWRGKAPSGVIYEDRRFAYAYEVGELQCPYPPYTEWVDIDQVQDLTKAIRDPDVCYAFIHLSEYSPPSFISTTRIRSEVIGGVKQLFPGNGRYSNLTYGLGMLRLKLDEGHKFGQTLFPIAGYLGYRKIPYKPFRGLVGKLAVGKEDEDPYTSWFYKMVSVMLVGNFASSILTYEPARPLRPDEIATGKLHTTLEPVYEGRNTYFSVYAAHVVDTQIANTTRRALGVTHPEDKILKFGVDGIISVGGCGICKEYPELGEWGIKWENKDPVRIYSDAFHSWGTDRKWDERYNLESGLLIIARTQYPDLFSVCRTVSDDREIRRLRSNGPRTIKAGKEPGSVKRVWRGGKINFLTEGGLEHTPSPKDIPNILMKPILSSDPLDDEFNVEEF